MLNLENIAVLAISKEVVQGIGHGSPQVIIRLVFAQIISKITGSEVTPFAVITDESTGVKYPLADYELLPKMAIVDADSGHPYGTLTAVSETGANPVYHMAMEDGREILIPAIPSVIVEVNLDADVIRLRPLEGLFDA